VGSAALFAGAAHAQVSASLTVDSDYRFRGVSLGNGRPSARAEANYDASNGWYTGGSFARAEFSDGGRYSQVTAYGGRVVPLTPTLNLDAGASLWWFSGGGYNFVEAYAAVLSREWTLRVNYSPNYFDESLKTLYFDATAHRLITDTWRVFVHAGALVRVSQPAPVDYSDYRNGSGAEPGRMRWDVRAGIGWNATGNLDLQLAWTKAGRTGPIPTTREGGRAAWVGSATWSF
jgi:uncharacterized protein (TIGR02001 family)